MLQWFKTKNQLIKELKESRLQIRKLQGGLEKSETISEELIRLATFPEQNPDLVIETDPNGNVTYLNPVAQERHGDLWQRGPEHPLLRDLEGVMRILEESNIDFVSREIDMGDTVYEQRICCILDDRIIRVFAHDITARKRAEEAIQDLVKELKMLSRQVVVAQEEERKRVSRELHDEAGQALVALKISLEIFQNNIPNKSKELTDNFKDAIALVDDTRDHIRLIAQGLRPPDLDTLGLNLTLQGLCRSISKRMNIRVLYEGLDLPPLPDTFNITLYRFLQEALSNVVVHADAKEVSVKLEYDTKVVCLSVVDDGRGFDPGLIKSATPASGIGLIGMRERLELLDGWLEIASDSGRGSRLVAFLPLDADL